MARAVQRRPAWAVLAAGAFADHVLEGGIEAGPVMLAALLTAPGSGQGCRGVRDQLPGWPAATDRHGAMFL